MDSMSRRVNIMLEDQVWRVLQKAPSGERSRIVNSALRQWFQTRKRRLDAAHKMDTLRQGVCSVSSDQIVDWLRVDRDRS
jgi:hypothetical protein